MESRSISHYRGPIFFPSDEPEIIKSVANHIAEHFGDVQFYSLRSQGIFIPVEGVRFTVKEPTGVLYYRESHANNCTNPLAPGRYEVRSCEKLVGISGVSFWLSLKRVDVVGKPLEITVKIASIESDGSILCVDWRSVVEN